MKFKLSDWASVAEVVSGVAVIVTLVFLVLGVKENSEITRASMYSDHLDSFNEHTRDLYRDPELARIWGAWLERDIRDLDASDRLRLNSMVATVFRTYEKAYLAHEAELYGDEEWDRMERLACLNFVRARGTVFEDTLKDLLTSSFFAFLHEACREQE